MGKKVHVELRIRASFLFLFSSYLSFRRKISVSFHFNISTFSISTADQLLAATVFARNREELHGITRNFYYMELISDESSMIETSRS